KPAVEPDPDVTSATEDAASADESLTDADTDATLAANSNAAIASGRIKLTIDELIALRSQNVTMSDLLEMRFLFPKVDIRDVAGMYAVGATPDYVRRIRAAGLDVRSAREAQSMAAVGVTPEFIADMRDAGLDVENADMAAGLAAVGVTSDWIREMRAT